MIRTPGPEPELTYALSDAAAEVPTAELVGVRSRGRRVERAFRQAKGEVGPSHHEVRSRAGWHHHITLSFLALRFLILGRRRIGGGETPAVTACQVRGIFARLLRRRPPTVAETAEEISGVPRGDEESRIHH